MILSISTIVLLLQCIFLSQIAPVTGFSSPSPSPPPKNFLSALTDLFENKASSTSTSGKTSAVAAAEREKLKSELIGICSCKNDESQSSTKMNDSEKRKNIESLIAELREMSPIKETATSPLLQKKWLL